MMSRRIALQCKAVRPDRDTGVLGTIVRRNQAQPPPTMDISWQGRYTDSPLVVTSGVSVIFVSLGMEVQRM